MWLIPDPSFWYYHGPKTGFTAFRKDVIKNDQPMLAKIPKLIWRGAVFTNRAVRQALIDAAVDKSWSAVEAFKWGQKGEENKFVSFVDHCQYAMNVHTEGSSWSGRLKYLISCHAVSFVHTLEWTTHFYHLLQSTGPHRNYIAVERDFSDLEAKVDMVMNNAEEAQLIADNAAATFRDRYLTTAADACYWRQLFRAYSTVAFKPTSEELGVPYEWFVYDSHLSEHPYPLLTNLL